MSLSNKQTYSLDNSQQQYYVFEIKIKTINDKYIFRKMKTSKDGCLLELDEPLEDITNVKISIFSFEEPNNPIIIKRKIDLFTKNILLTEKNVIINIVNKNKFVCYYKLF